MKVRVSTRFIPYQVARLEAIQYASNQKTCLQLKTLEGEPLCRCTVNIEGVELEEDEVAIKDYSENEGILLVLVTNGVVHPPHKIVEMQYPTHTISIPVCKLTSQVQTEFCFGEEEIKEKS